MIRRLGIHGFPPHPLNVECVAIVHPAGVPIRVLYVERDTRHVPTGLEYPRGRRLEMDWDPEGQARGYDMTSLQTCPCFIAGMGALSCWKIFFPTVR